VGTGSISSLLVKIGLLLFAAAGIWWYTDPIGFSNNAVILWLQGLANHSFTGRR